MIGSIIKYSLAAFAGAVVFATCMHVADEEALTHIEDMITAHEAVSRSKGLSEEELKTEMIAFIRQHRDAWDHSYTMADTGRKAQLLYGAWL